MRYYVNDLRIEVPDEEGFKILFVNCTVEKREFIYGVDADGNRGVKTIEREVIDIDSIRDLQGNKVKENDVIVSELQDTIEEKGNQLE